VFLRIDSTHRANVGLVAGRTRRALIEVDVQNAVTKDRHSICVGCVAVLHHSASCCLLRDQDTLGSVELIDALHRANINARAVFHADTSLSDNCNPGHARVYPGRAPFKPRKMGRLTRAGPGYRTTTMHVAIVGTYPPTRCGIATFTADVEQALRNNGTDVTVVEVLACADEHGRPDASISLLRDERSSYVRAAELVNELGCDVVLIQHEFGIFGGIAGAHLTSFTRALNVPYAVTLHTVLPTFGADESANLKELCANASVVTVFTATARRLLLEQGIAAARKLQIIPHGAPAELYATFDEQAIRHRLGLPATGPVLSTFGLLSEGKGIELAIRALADIVVDHPLVRYVIAGRTHPGVLRADGERYRDRLVALVDELALAGHVVFLNEFLGIQEVADLLAVTDVFCTPYRGEDQIVSGALTFALAAKCPVVSTPYRYAKDMLADGAGIMVGPHDVNGFTDAIRRLLAPGADRDTAIRAAANASKSLRWTTVGLTLSTVLANAIATTPSERRASVATELVVLDRYPATDHLRVVCDDTAVLQHAALKIPRAEDGYCVDDAARMLPVLADLAAGREGDEWNPRLARLLTFLRAATDDRGDMRNFMSWDRRWIDAPHQGDHVGRAVWGLGELVSRKGPYTDEAHDLLVQIAGSLRHTMPPRTLAYAALGLCAANAIQDCDLSSAFEQVVAAVGRWQPVTTNWVWPEPRLTYDNARLPETLLRVGIAIGEAPMIDTGTLMLDWFDERCLRGDHYRFPGHLGAVAGQDFAWSGDEQPLEAAAMADAHDAISAVRLDASDLVAIDRSWSWFLGENRLGIALGNAANGACFDGLGAQGANLNCGAESTIAFHRCAAVRQKALDRSAVSSPLATTAARP
jgi:glycosyltransferase involved in cell wall biosynthesis